MILVASLIVEAALARANCLGAHYREDFPQCAEVVNKVVNNASESKCEVENGEIFAE